MAKPKYRGSDTQEIRLPVIAKISIQCLCGKGVYKLATDRREIEPSLAPCGACKKWHWIDWVKRTVTHNPDTVNAVVHNHNGDGTSKDMRSGTR